MWPFRAVSAFVFACIRRPVQGARVLSPSSEGCRCLWGAIDAEEGVLGPMSPPEPCHMGMELLWNRLFTPYIGPGSVIYFPVGDTSFSVGDTCFRPSSNYPDTLPCGPPFSRFPRLSRPLPPSSPPPPLSPFFLFSLRFPFLFLPFFSLGCCPFSFPPPLLPLFLSSFLPLSPLLFSFFFSPLFPFFPLFFPLLFFVFCSPFSLRYLCFL